MYKTYIQFKLYKFNNIVILCRYLTYIIILLCSSNYETRSLSLIRCVSDRIDTKKGIRHFKLN